MNPHPTTSALERAEAEIARLTAELSAARAASPAVLQSVLDSAVSGIMALDAIRDASGAIVDFRFTLANPMSERMVARRADEILGRRLLDLFPGNVQSGQFDAYVRVVETGEPMEMETHYRDDRLEFWLSVSAVKLGDGVAVTFTDISDRRRIEAEAIERVREIELQRAALQRSNELLADQRRFAETLVERLPAGLAYIDKDFVFRVANPTLAQFYGVPLASVLNRHVYDVLPGSAKDIQALYEQVRATLEPVFVAALPVSYAVDGVDRLTYWDATVLPYLDGDCEFDGWLALATEVSERVEADREFRRQKELTSRMVDHTPAAMAYLNRDLVYEWANPRHAESLGITVEQTIGRDLVGTYGAVGATVIAPLLKQVLATGEPFSAVGFPITYEVDGAMRQTYWDTTYQPVVLDGHVDGVLILAQEVSERVEKEQLLAERMSALEEADQLKNQFLSILSHELRTPINAMMGFGSVLDDELVGPLNDEQRRYTGKILAASDNLLALVSDLLDMSRIQAGKFTITTAPVLPGYVVPDVLLNHVPAADAKAITLRNDVGADLPPVLADEQRLAQIFSNLVGNALKFTPPGGIIRLAAVAEAGELRFEVADDGVGIPLTAQAGIFEAFTQVDMSNTRQSGGVGLGLTICKSLVEAHGGRIGVHSDGPGQGTTFWFTLPLAAGG